jgi:hypothetical protein
MGAWDWLDVEAVAAKKGNDGRCEGGERGSGHSEEAGARTHTHTERKSRSGLTRHDTTRYDTMRHDTRQDNTTRWHGHGHVAARDIHIHPTF